MPSSEAGHDNSGLAVSLAMIRKRSMGHALKHFSIVDITQHAELEIVTGKVKFQFQESVHTTEGLQHYIVIDVAVAATGQDTLETIEKSLLEKAFSVLQSSLAAVRHVENRALLAGRPDKMR